MYLGYLLFTFGLKLVDALSETLILVLNFWLSVVR
jgi:hypothetical protein